MINEIIYFWIFFFVVVFISLVFSDKKTIRLPANHIEIAKYPRRFSFLLYVLIFSTILLVISYTYLFYDNYKDTYKLYILFFFLFSWLFFNKGKREEK